MDAKGIGRASIVGHSLGSMVGQRIAADHPARVEKLVLIGSTALAPITRGDWAWTNVTALTAPIDPAHPFIRDFTSNPTPVDPDFAAHALRETVATPLHVWHGVLRELADVPVGRFAADIAAPTLILAGEADALFDARHQQALRDAIPHARYRMFPDLGHNLIWERPELVGPELGAFLDQNARK